MPFNRILLISTILLLPLPVQAQLNVFACEPEWVELAQKIGGSNVSVYSATTAFQDPHHIEARPSLIAKIRNADFVICSGAGLEAGWLPLLLRKAGNPKVLPGKDAYFEAAMVVDRLGIQISVDRSEGDVHGKGNPHVHLDPARLIKVAEEVNARLATIDNENKAHYRSNLEAWKLTLSKREEKWKEQALQLKGKKVVVHHMDWDYLFEWTGIEVITTIEPKPGLPPSGSDLKRLSALLEGDKPDAIIVAAYQNAKPARWLSEKLGVPMVQLPFTIGGSERAKDYPQLLDETLELLISATNAKTGTLSGH